MSRSASLERWMEGEPKQVPSGKIVSYITGELKDDDEHERNRQDLARRLAKNMIILVIKWSLSILSK